jgi:16S rRNA (cytosine967-C5)-methyltransferase
VAKTDPRLLAIDNLRQVLAGRSLDALLSDKPTGLDERDRALLAELSYGLCRWYGQLAAIIHARLQKPLRKKDQDIYLLLLLGVYQLMHSRIPAHAAISTSVGLTRVMDKGWASKLVNGVLRGVQRDLTQPASALQQLLHESWETHYAQPAWFVKALKQAWPQQAENILAALQTRAPMTLRLNPKRISMPDYQAQLQQAGLQAKTINAVPSALVLDKAQAVEKIPGFADGVVSVQDAGAQLAALLLDVQNDQKILDACAAPGGKTGHILELADDLKVTAVDVDKQRLARVTQNLQRLKLSAELMLADASQPPAAWQTAFDRILLDAPCSATGVMRRHPDIRLLRREQDIANLVQRQAALLEALWPCLKPGGKLLYATCSVLSAENQQQMQSFVQKHPDAHVLPLAQDWGHACSIGRQTLPGEQTMDGFYYALLEKIDV